MYGLPPSRDEIFDRKSTTASINVVSESPCDELYEDACSEIKYKSHEDL
jgi:hypothetical protein